MASVNRDHIGPYRLLKLVRAGQTTHVWLAMNSIDHRRVALKALREEFRGDRNEISSLKHEYIVGKALDHANVIHIHDFFTVRDIPFLVMDYFNAPNLKQCIRQHPERIQQHAQGIITQGAAALGHMHQAGWIHRDVKPDNFLVNKEGIVKLIDFSIAQKIKTGFGRLLTGKAAIQGTRSYMSPEQIRGEPVDARADIYGYACTVFEMLTGRPPFTGNNADDLLNRHLRAPVPSLASFNDRVTPDFARLLTRMMAKRAEERPATMEEVLAELGQVRILKHPGRHTI